MRTERSFARPGRYAGLWLLALWLGAGPLAAQDTVPENVQVEVLVFAYENGGSGSEAAAGSIGDRPYDLYVLGEPPGEGMYRVLPASAQRLAGAAGVLGRSARSRVLLHTGWRQPSRYSRRIRLQNETRMEGPAPARGLLSGSSPELEGWIELEAGRGLRVQLDLLLGRQAGEQVETFRLNQTRVLSTGELHYFDHPAFGVIVRVDSLDPAS
ncbi:MAG: CsiV family protein [Lysobacterales bacterium]